MKKNIKQLIEYYQKFIGQDVLNTGDDFTEVPQDYLYKYYPKTYQDLEIAIYEHIVNENFNFNDINVSEVESMANLFYNINYVLSRSDKYYLNGRTVKLPIKKLPNFDVSQWEPISCTNFSNLFKDLEEFNCDISRWNVSQGKNFTNMFLGCRNFNQDLSGWDMSSAENLNMMFYKCSEFTSDLSKWKVDNVYNFSHMFCDCTKFTSDLKNWNVSSGREFYSMFCRCKNFKSDLSKWETKIYDPTKVKYMFTGCDMSNIILSPSFEKLIKEIRKVEQEEADLDTWYRQEREKRFDKKPHHY